MKVFIELDLDVTVADDGQPVDVESLKRAISNELPGEYTTSDCLYQIEAAKVMVMP